MRYTLRQLEIFLATAHFQNLSKAASDLAMSQSAASGALKELESQFDVQLFDRIGKRLQLNDLGRSLQPLAEELIERARELELAFGHNQDGGKLRIGATLSIGNYIAMPLIDQFTQQNPRSQLSLDVANTATIADKVINFDLDVGLIEGEVNRPELDVSPWQQDELVVFCNPDHPFAKKKTINDDDVQSAKWILRETGSGTRQTFDRAMHDLLPQLNILLELQHTEGIKRAVEAGMGLGCLSKVTLVDAFKRGSLVPLTLKDRNLKRMFYLIVHKQKYRSAVINDWISLCFSKTVKNR